MEFVSVRKNDVLFGTCPLRRKKGRSEEEEKVIEESKSMEIEKKKKTRVQKQTRCFFSIRNPGSGIGRVCWRVKMKMCLCQADTILVDAVLAVAVHEPAVVLICREAAELLQTRHHGLVLVFAAATAVVVGQHGRAWR